METRSYELIVHINDFHIVEFNDYDEAVEAFRKAKADYPTEHIEMMCSVVDDNGVHLVHEREYAHGMTCEFNVEAQLCPDYEDETWGVCCDASELDYV